MPEKMFNQFLCSSLMLPEHREALNRRAAQLRQQEKMCRPCIDAQQWELWDRLISEALHQERELSILCLDEQQGSRLLRGVLCGLDPQHRELIIRNSAGMKRIPIESIMGVDN